MAPPPGHTPNFDNPESLHPIVLGVGVASIVLMTTALAIRIYTKAVLLKDMRAEECEEINHALDACIDTDPAIDFAILGTIGIITWDAMFIEVSVNGFSRHLWDVRLTEVPNLSYVSTEIEYWNSFGERCRECDVETKSDELPRRDHKRPNHVCGEMFHSVAVQETILPRSSQGLDLLEHPRTSLPLRSLLYFGHLHLHLSVHVCITAPPHSS